MWPHEQEADITSVIKFVCKWYTIFRYRRPSLLHVLRFQSELQAMWWCVGVMHVHKMVLYGMVVHLSHQLCNSSPLVTHMRQWIGSALVQIMGCHLLVAKPLSTTMLGYCQLDPLEEFSVKFYSKYKTFHSRKCLKIVSAKRWPFCSGGDELILVYRYKN